MTTSRPIHELKRVYNNLFEVLKKENVYIWKTKLETTDTVELGFFVGLHPSLTNLEWRQKQLESSLGLEQGPKFQIYRHRLRAGVHQISCIVLACAKKDAPVLQTKMMNYGDNELGKGVEFIPYRMASYWSEKTYLEVFIKKTQYIDKVGELPIQGITQEEMTQEKGGVTLLSKIISHGHILGIE